jgi:predicted anti-sigma-YlaC factor YlaD
MVCNRFQSDGMRLLDGEMAQGEKERYEEHVRGCEDCRRELHDMGRIVRFTDELRLRPPDEEFWAQYWSGVARRMERNVGFLLLVIGVVGVLLVAIYKAVTSPDLLTFKGLSVTAALLGLVVLFLSVARERFHESKSDPYKEVKQ